MSDGDLKYYERFLAPVLAALRELGGSARAAQVKLQVLDSMNFSEAARGEVTPRGLPRLGKQIAWARFYLAKSGYLDSSKRGVWSLTEKGKNADLRPEDVRSIIREINAQFKPDRIRDTKETSQLSDVGDESPASQIDHRQQLLDTLRSIPPGGFEELCRYLLLVSGFEEVTVTGRSGDGGIDGHGLLRVGKLVSMKVLFQCKRVTDSVGSNVVRDFRGALSGRADQGIILTTGYFTSSAEQEAKRDGVVPIELVDGDRIVELFEEMEIGLKNPRTVFDIDDEFFRRYRS